MIPQGVLPIATDQLGCSIVDLDHATIAATVDRGTEESEELDFKREYAWQGGSRDDKRDAKDELAKDVAAFANHRGGVIIVGVADQYDRAVKVMSVDTRGRFDAWVRETVATWVRPQPTVDLLRLPGPKGDDSGFWVVVVLPSQDRPHAVVDPADDTYTMRFPVRVGRATRWWSPAQVQQEHARRRDRRDRRRQVSDDLLEAATPALDKRLWLVTTVVPDAPGWWAINDRQVREVSQMGQLESVYGREQNPDVAVPIVGGIRAKGRDGGEHRRATRLVADYHEDGSSLVAVEVRKPDDGGDRWRAANVAVIRPNSGVDDLLWCLRTGFRHARAAGCFGLATATASLWTGNPTTLAVLGTSEEGQSAHVVPASHDRRSGELSGVPVTVPIPTAEDDRATLLSARAVLTPFVQHFGLAEVPMINDEGAVSLSEVGHGESMRARLENRFGWCVVD